ncbi:MAG: MBL fold metallo-hydrolase [Bacteroidales bacterium]|nr:MBL fold metallo-hydrolase [Bacteroidales bacterium]MCF8391678.1 MBL fold metallo-hydrolase [Bacteroidales bacterium]
MEVTFLGTGTSQGVPVIACKCDICKSNDTMDTRLRSSVLLKKNNSGIVIDTSPDFRYQMLRAKVDSLDAVLYTHEHRDHIAGLDDIRSFNYIQKEAMNVFCEERVFKALKNEFPYVFAEHKYPGIPQVIVNLIKSEVFKVKEFEILPIRAMHMRLPVLGYRIDNFAYITDANYIPEEELKKLKDLDFFVINALRKEKHISHFCLQGALDLIQKISPKKAYLTHISHQMGLHSEVSNELPENVFLAYDGLKLIC